MANAAKKPETDSTAKSNTEATFLAISSEMVALEDEIDRVMEPLKERRKDLASVAKDAKFNLKALKRSVKIKRADNAKRKAYAEEIQAEEQSLHWMQVELFPAAAK